jgi:OOP family OmpA-OmpF porin
VQLELAGGVLRAAGTAPQAWIERARLLAATLPAVDRLDEADLRAAESLTALRAASDALTRLELRFPRGSARVASARRLEQAAALVQQALAAAAAARTGVCIVISGHADPTGSQERNLALARARALTVAGALSERGVPAELLRASGAGVWTGAGDARAARKVTLRVHSGARCQDSR